MHAHMQWKCHNAVFLCIKPFWGVIIKKHEYIIGIAVIHKNIQISIGFSALRISLEMYMQALNKALSQSLPINNDLEFVSEQLDCKIWLSQLLVFKNVHFSVVINLSD